MLTRKLPQLNKRKFMKEEGISIRKTTEASRADYKTTTTIQVMSDSEAKPDRLFYVESPKTSYLIADN